MAQRPEDFDPANINSRVAESIPIPTTVTAGAWDNGTAGPKNSNAGQAIVKPWPKWIRILLTVGASLTILILFGWGVSEQTARERAEQSLGSQSSASSTQFQDLSGQLTQAKQQVLDEQKVFQKQLEDTEVAAALARSNDYSNRSKNLAEKYCPQCFRMQIQNTCHDWEVKFAVWFVPPGDNKFVGSGWWTVKPGSTQMSDMVSQQGNFYVYAYAPSNNWSWNGSGKDDSITRTVPLDSSFFMRDDDAAMGRNKQQVSFYKHRSSDYGVYTEPIGCPGNN